MVESNEMEALDMVLLKYREWVALFPFHTVHVFLFKQMEYKVSYRVIIWLVSSTS